MAGSYTSPGPRATPAILALYVVVGACLLVIGADVGRISVARGLAGRPSPPEAAAAVQRLVDADRLVQLATGAEVIAVVAAVVLVARWLRVVRGNRAPLGGRGPRAPLTPVFWALVAAAVVAVALSQTVLGAAETAADRQRIDALRAGATALAALAAGSAIALVAQVTRRQAAAAGALAARLPPPPARTPGPTHTEGGLRVVREEDAQRRELDA